jgi:hypothetical protein
MSVIDQIKSGKAGVKTDLLPGGSIRISARVETNEAIEHFQRIAEEAIAEAESSGRQVRKHLSSRRSGYDTVVIGPPRQSLATRAPSFCPAPLPSPDRLRHFRSRFLRRQRSRT